MLNNVQVSGYLFSHSLTQNVSKNNNNYIRGRMEIALDADFTRVVPVQWLVMETRTSEYNTLQSIINDGISVQDGRYKNKNEITKVRITGNIDVSDYVSRNTGQLVSYQQIRGGFIHLMHDPIPEDNNCTFRADTYLNFAEYVDDDAGVEPYMRLKGFVFDFRGHLIPVTFNTCTLEGGHFFETEQIDADNPFFSTVYGRVEPSTVVSSTQVDESNIGFGTPIVQETTRSFITWLIDSSEINKGVDESTISDEEFQNAMRERQVELADVRSRYEMSNSRPASGFGTTTKSNPNSSGYVF